jgi:hypothetical protein
MDQVSGSTERLFKEVEKLPDFISEERNQMIGQTIDRVEVLP